MSFEDPTKVSLEGTPEEVIAPVEDPLDTATTLRYDPLNDAPTNKVEVPPEATK